MHWFPIIITFCHKYSNISKVKIMFHNKMTHSWLSLSKKKIFVLENHSNIYTNILTKPLSKTLALPEEFSSYHIYKYHENQVINQLIIRFRRRNNGKEMYVNHETNVLKKENIIITFLSLLSGYTPLNFTIFRSYHVSLKT
jgi:predicted glycosyltransferase